jgi:ATP-dependent protease HslVU (ClpYQ) ATPase subunit
MDSIPSIAAPVIAQKTTRRINLALQGGGTHGAFTWGAMERLLEEVSFSASDLGVGDQKELVIDAEYVEKQLGDLARNEDLSRFIL